MNRVTWISLILGIWLIVSPLALGYAPTSAQTANDILLGVLLVLCSAWIVRRAPDSSGVNWFEVLCSIWLCAAPFALHYQRLSPAMTNDLAIGIITLVVGLVEGWTLLIEPVKS